MKKVSSGECCHVVQMVGCVSTALPLALALEFVPFGDLLSYLKYWRQKVRPSQQCIVDWQCIFCACFAYIHINFTKSTILQVNKLHDHHNSKHAKARSASQLQLANTG